LCVYLIGQPSKCRPDELSSFADVFGDDDLRELSFIGIRENSVMGAVYLSVPGAPCWVGLPMMPPFMEHRAGGIPVPYWEYGGESIVEGDSMPYVVAVRIS
jgi:hypothetical protein